ncbi:hypothetical protein AQUCO_00200221v1 [Aquilegia coerulea]|uniref:Uncharacterized protein n=1 Tax=Aquilegia coerulea TaxID=218851 RepID=A0A2G5F236_AQUCA|nr:hypothetical protein AQUCO_00200221v1 [Aquilegia coerulea]
MRQLNYLEAWDWKFQTNYFDTTHFFCDMWWAETDRGRHNNGSLELYVAKRDEVICYHHCRYYAKVDGVYLYNIVKKRLDLMYSWPK